MKFVTFECYEMDKSITVSVQVDRIVAIVESKSYSESKVGIFIDGKPESVKLPGKTHKEVLNKIMETMKE